MQDLPSIEEMSKKLKPIMGTRIDRLYMNYSFAEELEKKREIARFIHALYIKYVDQAVLKNQILLEPPVKQALNGEYPIGKVYYAGQTLQTFNLRESDWQRHVCITGMSGSGKTTLSYQIIKNFITNQKPFIIMDWKKSFRPLMLIDPDMMLFTIGNSTTSNSFKVNINKPPQGVPPKEWISIISDVIIESFSASHGTAKILAETMDKAFRDFKVYQGSENYPTWYQIRDRLEEKENHARNKRRESEWLTSATRIAHMLTFGDYGECLNTKGAQEMTVQDLMNKRVIFELHSLNTAQKKFYCEYLMTYIYKMKKNMNMTPDCFEHAIIVDEAHNIFLKDKPVYVKETITDMIYREMREYGESLIVLDQHISKLSEVVVGNSACVIAFQQTLPRDVATVSDMMQLKQHRDYFSMLEVGQAVVRLAERHNQAFMIKTPYIPLKKKNVSNEYVIQRMKKLMQERMVAKAINSSTEDGINQEMHELKKIYNNSGVQADTQELKKIYSQEPSGIQEARQEQLEKEEKTFLELISRKELTVSQAYRQLGLSARKGNQIKKALLEKQLIQEKEERNSKGWKKLLVPTQEMSITA